MLSALSFVVVAEPSLECSIDLGSQIEIADCVAEVEATVDKTTELALGFAMNATIEMDEIIGREVAAAALVQGRSAWFGYRDAHCEHVGWTFRGDSGTDIAIHSCRVELGRARVTELMNYAQ